MGRGSSKVGSSKPQTYETKNSFSGNVHKVSNKYFIPEKQVIDNDNIILYTSDIGVVKGNAVLIVDDNKAVYLKDWNLTGVRFRNGLDETYAVKLNRKYFKPYTFKTNIDDDILPGKEYSFDDLKKIAKSQEKRKEKITTYRVLVGSRDITKL